ncbi:hypothetical protein FRC15_011289 [Serendipita sp. 397]|nr:hypothetical protein FRC15_011289 [Serendipita sp. 397]
MLDTALHVLTPSEAESITGYGSHIVYTRILTWYVFVYGPDEIAKNGHPLTTSCPLVFQIYGVEAYARGDGFTAAQSFLNIVESIVNFIYVYKAHISKDPIAPLIGFTAATCSFSKTVLYWAQEYFCNYCAVGHNGLSTLFWLWVIPNGLVLIDSAPGSSFIR